MIENSPKLPRRQVALRLTEAVVAEILKESARLTIELGRKVSLQDVMEEAIHMYMREVGRRRGNSD